MLIGIDGRAFSAVQVGTGRYATELCRALDAEMPEASFFVYGNRPLNLPVANRRWHQRANDTVIESRIPPSLWFFLRAGVLAKHDGVDVFWGTANFLPLGLDSKTPSVLTVHDVVYRLFPQTLNLKHRLAYRLFFNRSLHSAQLVATNSNGTSNRLSQLYGRSADLVIRPRVTPNFRPPKPEAILAVLEHYGIDFPYFLSVATLEPRKNLEALIQAYLELRITGHLAGTGLVLVGQQGWKHRRLINAITNAKSQGARIVLTGYVSDEWLPALYAGAEAVVIPSLYEGFGMPVLEALCCGARVIASDIPEIREAGGSGPIYIEPTVEGIKKGLQKAEKFSPTDTAPANLSIDRGSSWEEEGRKLVNAIRSLL
jgi:glycosyltransferase involved in cell wall biosynthesis